jgi:hypothetical protein
MFLVTQEDFHKTMEYNSPEWERYNHENPLANAGWGKAHP